MHPGFSFEVDRRRNLIRFVLTGLFMPGDVSAFLEARRKAHAKLTCAPGQHVTLTDLRAIKILPQESVDAWTAHLTDPQTRVRRLAFLVGPTLVRSQLMRALAGRDSRHTRCFTDPAEAEAWLLEEDRAVLVAASRYRSSRKPAPALRPAAIHSSSRA
jgi:hypothetical protein